MLGSQSSTERENGRVQSPLHSRGKENGSGDGVSIVPFPRKTTAGWCQGAMGVFSSTVNDVSRVKGCDSCSPPRHHSVDGDLRCSLHLEFIGPKLKSADFVKLPVISLHQR